MALPTTDDFKKIANLYVSLFNRAPDTAGLNFWANAVANGASLSTVTQGFLTAPEGVATYPTSQTANAFVTAFYTTVFGRAPDAGGLQFWTAALANMGGVGSAAARSQLVSQIVNVVSAPLSAADAALPANAQSVLDRALFANKIDYGLYLATQTTLAGASWNAANLALDKVTTDAGVLAALKAAALAQQNGGGAVDADRAFAYTDAQLNVAGFTVIGGSGTDTLALTVSANVAGTPANVLNVERVTVYTDGAAPATTTIDGSRFVGSNTIVSASTKELIFNNLGARQAGLVNGKDAANTPLTNGNTTFSYADSVTSASANLTGGVTAGTVSVLGANLNSVSIASTAGPNTITGLVLGTSVSTLSINTASALKFGGVGANWLSGGVNSGLSVIVAGAGQVDFSNDATAFRPQILSLNASLNSGGVLARISGDAARATTIVGSSAADTIRLYSTFGDNTSVNLGAGDDFLGGQGATFGTGSIVDGGTGTNTLSFYALSAANGGVFRNFQTLNLTNIAGDTPLSTTVNLDDMLSNTVTSLVNGANNVGGLTVQNVSQALTIKGAASSDAVTTTLQLKAAALPNYTINFDAAASGAVIEAGVVSVASVEGLTIASNGASTNTNKITISDAALKTLTVTGATALQVAFNLATTATDTIDASALTKAFTLNTTNVVAGAGVNGLVVKGSATAINTLTITQKAIVTGGTAADTVNLTGLGVTGTTELDITNKLVTITNFGSGDKIDFGTIVGGSTGTTLHTYTPGGGDTLDVAVAAAIIAAAAETTTAKEFVAFVLSGSTYIAADIDHSGTFTTGDVVVKLDAPVSLVGAAIDVAAATITLSGIPI